MGIFDFFKKEAPTGPDPTRGLTLSTMKPGYLVDHDLTTWEVKAYNYYEWGPGDRSWEWQLQGSAEVVYLEKETDDEDHWSLNRKLPFSRLDPAIKRHILEHDDPPEEIVFEDETYHLEETAAGHFFRDGHPPGQPMIKWDYSDEEGRKYLTIEQWGETEFESSTGVPVQEYQFTNILPGGNR